MLILIVEDDEGLVELIKEKSEECGCRFAAVYTASGAVEWLSGNTPSIMLLDYTLPDMNAKEFISEIEDKGIKLPPFIISTGRGSERTAVEMMKLGARDYIVKDGNYLDMLPEIIRRAAREIDNENRLEEAKLLFRQTRQNYETFFNTIDEFLFVLDEQGRIIHMNDLVVNRLGYSRDELRGESVLIVHPPERREEAGRIVGQMLEGTADFCPVPVVTKSGVQIPVETRITRGLWDGSPAIFGVTKDISQLRLSEEKFSKLFYINPSACGLSSLEDHRFIEVNEAFYTLFGFTRDEVIGKSAAELGILTSDAVNSIMLKADNDGRIRNAETVLRAKNGDIKYAIMSSDNIHVQDKQFRFTVVHDITERKIAEEKVKALLAEKELILKEVHHRIKNNMNTIKSLLYIQADMVDDPAGRAALRDAENRVDSMMVLYEKLYRSSDYQVLLVKEYIPVLAEEIINNFPNRNIVKLEISIEEFNLNTQILFPLGIIINELLTNMMKYAFKGRESGIVSITASMKDSRIYMVIRDNGIGIPEEVNFDNAGTFGMQLVGMLVQQIGGSIKIERGNGSAFVLEFGAE